jgi:DNA-binding NarL/FixJ family response regulator
LSYSRRMTGTSEPIRVLLVDDEPMFVEALTALLDADVRVNVVAVAGNGPDAVELARQESPDVALVDIALPGVDGLETTRLLLAQAPAMKVVVLSGRSDETGASDAEAAGASRFLFKGDLHDEIADAIVDAHTL